MTNCSGHIIHSGQFIFKPHDQGKGFEVCTTFYKGSPPLIADCGSCFSVAYGKTKSKIDQGKSTFLRLLCQFFHNPLSSDIPKVAAYSFQILVYAVFFIHPGGLCKWSAPAKYAHGTH